MMSQQEAAAANALRQFMDSVELRAILDPHTDDVKNQMLFAAATVAEHAMGISMVVHRMDDHDREEGHFSNLSRATRS